jgi:SAM-dependent methyltransferase
VEDADYARRVAAEARKWGRHLEVEATGEWHAWLDHPQVLAHYRRRAELDGLSWHAWLRRRLGGPAEASFDLGCGAAGTSMALYDEGAARVLEGIDVSPDRVAEAERQRLARGATGGFRVGDVNRLALPESAYDLIFSVHSFHHFLELERILDQVIRALTPRGLFVLEEYVGPTRFQWSDRQMALVRELLSLVPPRYRTFRWGAVKDGEGRPSVQEVVAVSPFESIRSADIVPLFERRFEMVEVRRLGGTLQHLLYNGIAHNFATSDPEATRIVRAVCEVEDALVDGGLLPSDFMLLVGRRR